MQKDILRRLLRCCCCCCVFCFWGGDGGASDEDGWLLSGGFEKVWYVLAQSCLGEHASAAFLTPPRYLSPSVSSILCFTLWGFFSFFFLSFDADVAKIKSPLPYLTPWGQNPFRSSPRVFLSRTVPSRPSNGQRFQLFSPHMRPPPNNSPRICSFFFFVLSRMLPHQSICHAVDRCHAGARINSPVRQHTHTHAHSISLDFFFRMRAVDPTRMCASHTPSLAPPSSK